MRFFHVLCLPNPSEDCLRTIFESILLGFLQTKMFPDQVRKSGSSAVSATIDLFKRVCDGFLPTPAKFHYTFNLRDVSKVFQGICTTRPVNVATPEVFCRLWIHECSRVFQDRLIDENDRTYFQEQVLELLQPKFHFNWKNDIFAKSNPITFSTLLKIDSDENEYEEVGDNRKKLLNLLEGYLSDYTVDNKDSQMDLVFFDDAVAHICRITRILTQPRGNTMLIGVSGCGKQSLTRLCSYLLGYKFFQVRMSKDSNSRHFQEAIKEQMLDSGCLGKPMSFVMTDTQITRDSFLEDINNFLNTGEVSGLYNLEDKQRMTSDLTPVLEKLKIPATAEAVYNFYIDRVRDYFHVVLCMSPDGDRLRKWCLKFPSLVNCCTLNWFDNWPADALESVASRFFESIDNIPKQHMPSLANIYMRIH